MAVMRLERIRLTADPDVRVDADLAGPGGAPTVGGGTGGGMVPGSEVSNACDGSKNPTRGVKIPLTWAFLRRIFARLLRWLAATSTLGTATRTAVTITATKR